jgi:hypothetical protein
MQVQKIQMEGVRDMSHSEPEHNRRPEGTEPDDPFPKIGRLGNGEPGYVVTESPMRSPATNKQWTIQEYANSNSAHILCDGKKVNSRAIPYDSATELIAAHNTELDEEKKDHEREVFDNWNKAAQEIEKLREILRACKPLARAWAAEELEDRIEDALPKE